MADKRVHERFEKEWRFRKGNPRGAHKVEFKDGTWRKLDLPHDWSIEEPFDEKAENGAGGGYLPGGKAWYRKTFALPAEYAGKQVSIEFDGVYMDATVWINGTKLGIHHYGYTSFAFDLTPHLHFGKTKNVIAVQVDNSKLPNTRWYSGSGIYRHVWLTVTDTVHVAHWGTAVSTPKVSKTAATIQVATEIVNDRDTPAEVELTTRIVGPDRKTAATIVNTKEVGAGKTAEITQDARIPDPVLWDIEIPALYKAITKVKVKRRLVDNYTTTFGIRTAVFDARKGFLLNGNAVMLKGVDLHHDNGCLGAVVYDRAEERKVELMKGIGVNAIRTSHNPPSPEFLDACDRLGVVVIDEAFDEWKQGKRKHGYKDYFDECWQEDLASMVRRDRNHPAVVLWSIGNECPEQENAGGAAIAKKMAKHIRKLDPTRPVGYGAHPGFGKRKPMPGSAKLWKHLDVAGYNYRDDLYAKHSKEFPDRPILGSETFSLYAFRTWERALANRNVVGEFIWTGMDYIGEAGIGHAKAAHTEFPVNTACCGEVDICGFKKTRSYYRDIVWGTGNTQLHIAVRRRLSDGEPFKLSAWGWPEAKNSWTWPDAVPGWSFRGKGEDVQVDVYSACDEVELRINGRTIGRNTTSKSSRYLATWIVPYEPGALEAIGYNNGSRVAKQILKTAGAPAKIKLTPDRKSIKANGEDLAYVTVELFDKENIFHPNADDEVRFTITGPGEILAVGNGDPAAVEPFQANRRHAHNGRCLVVVRSAEKKGKIKLTARAKGLQPAETVITVR